MSMPYSTLSCPACDYGMTTICLWGRFVYRDVDGTEAFIDRRLGWCHGCRRVAAIEVLPDAVRVAAERAEAQEQVDSLSPVEPNRPPARFRWLRDLLPSRGEREDLKKARAELRRTELLAAVIAAAQGPRCLSCGSPSVEPIPLPDLERLEYPHDLEIDFRHPGCKPAMRFKDSGGTRFAMVPTKRVYDVQGRLVGREDILRRRR